MWQGPALYAFNDAVFTDADFSNICNFGNSHKDGDDNSIGKFGLGFNSVYTFTDVPSIASGTKVLLFDPHAHFLPPPCSSADPGLLVEISACSQFPDQFQ